MVAFNYTYHVRQNKGKGIPRQAEVALGVPGRLRPRIFSNFGTTRVVGRQTNAPAAFTPGEIPSTHFRRLSRPQGTWFCRKEPRKKSEVTPRGIDRGTVRPCQAQFSMRISTVHSNNSHLFTPFVSPHWVRYIGRLDRTILNEEAPLKLAFVVCNIFVHPNTRTSKWTTCRNEADIKQYTISISRCSNCKGFEIKPE
jgi:hypothetical protein